MLKKWKLMSGDQRVTVIGTGFGILFVMIFVILVISIVAKWVPKEAPAPVIMPDRYIKLPLRPLAELNVGEIRWVSSSEIVMDEEHRIYLIVANTGKEQRTTFETIQVQKQPEGWIVTIPENIDRKWEPKHIWQPKNVRVPHKVIFVPEPVAESK